jgi:hypothetical protein
LEQEDLAVVDAAERIVGRRGDRRAVRTGQDRTRRRKAAHDAEDRRRLALSDREAAERRKPELADRAADDPVADVARAWYSLPAAHGFRLVTCAARASDGTLSSSVAAATAEMTTR